MTARKPKAASDTKPAEPAPEREPGRSSQHSALRAVSRPQTLARTSLGMAEHVRAVLIPVEPSQQFVHELGRSLTAAAMRSRQSLVRRYRMAIVIGAAVFGSIASVVGVVALIVRQRSRMRTGLLRSARGG